MEKRRILISVTDKRGIEKFKALTDLGWEIISTGGTAKKLQALGIPCVLVEDVTGFPEMMDGRLKTLHPNIFGGILADRSQQEHMDAIAQQGIKPIDIVVVNFYDFDGKPGIENIDIGGPSLLRACAKNGLCTTPIVDPEYYDYVISEIQQFGDVCIATRETLAMKVFNYTSEYDKKTYNWMFKQEAMQKSIFLK